MPCILSILTPLKGCAKIYNFDTPPLLFVVQPFTGGCSFQSQSLRDFNYCQCTTDTLFTFAVFQRNTFVVQLFQTELMIFISDIF